MHAFGVINIGGMKTAHSVRKYVIDGIEGEPSVLSAVLASVGPEDSHWDKRLFPERITLREALAHWADWDEVFIRRIERIRDEEHPFLESVDEGRLCEERKYVGQDGIENLVRQKMSRVRLVSILRSLPDEAWERTANRELVGDVTMAQLAAMILGHDAYHLRQSADYVSENE